MNPVIVVGGAVALGYGLKKIFKGDGGGENDSEVIEKTEVHKTENNYYGTDKHETQNRKPGVESETDEEQLETDVESHPAQIEMEPVEDESAGNEPETENEETDDQNSENGEET